MLPDRKCDRGEESIATVDISDEDFDSGEENSEGAEGSDC